MENVKNPWIARPRAKFLPRILETLRPEMRAVIGEVATWMYAGTGGLGEPYPGQQRWTARGDERFGGRWVPAEDLVLVEDEWQQGRLLMTPEVARWPESMKERYRQDEARRVFRNFSALDDGRSRELVAVCATPEEAAQMVEQHNAAIKAV